MESDRWRSRLASVVTGSDRRVTAQVPAFLPAAKLVPALEPSITIHHRPRGPEAQRPRDPEAKKPGRLGWLFGSTSGRREENDWIETEKPLLHFDRQKLKP